MKMLAFASRNTKEMLRDALTLGFGIGFPLVLLLLLTLIQSNIPVQLFEISSLTPGVTVFGLTFIALFAGMLIAKDRSSSFMLRLYTSPMTARDIILGYMLPLLPMSVLQMAVCYIAAAALGLPVTLNILLAIAVELPAAVMFISIGLICGSLMNDKQVGGICGALLTNVCAWLSGIWFDISLVGGAFEKIADLLPFVHSVRAGRAAMAGDYASIMPELVWVIVYSIAVTAAAIIIFAGKISSPNK